MGEARSRAKAMRWGPFDAPSNSCNRFATATCATSQISSGIWAVPRRGAHAEGDFQKITKRACPLIVKYHVPHTPTYNTRSSFHRRAAVAEAASSKR